MNDQMNHYPALSVHQETLVTALTAERAVISRRALLGAAFAAALATAGCSGSAQGSEPSAASPNITASPSDTSVSPQPSASVSESATPSHEDMEHSTDPQLRLLAGYEKESDVRINEMMLFLGLPKDPEDAKQRAASLVGTLTEYAKYGVTPLIVLEPTHDGTADVDLPQLETTLTVPDTSGQTILGAYTDTLKQQAEAAGLRGDQQGTWILLSEPNLPEWANGVTAPDVFRRNYGLLASALKNALPDAKRALLLNNLSYPNGNTNEDRPDDSLDTLSGYLNGLQGMVDVLGFQGFQWGAGDKATDYLSAGKVIALAKQVGAGEVLLNTGTLGSIPAASRAANLSGQLAQAAQIQAANLPVTVNWYLSNDGGGANWSFRGEQHEALDRALRDADRQGVALSLYDAS